MDEHARTILILDDDEQFIEVMRAGLESEGYRVREAVTAKSASAIIANETIDLVFVDGLLPDIDGVTWITELRRTNKDLRVVFITAHGRREGAFNWLSERLDVSAVLNKPVTPDAVVKCVDRILRRPPAPDAAGATGAKAKLQEKLEVLRAAYVERLPSMLDDLGKALETARSRPADGESLAQASLLAHRLRGTAPVHGLADVGAAAGEIEDTLLLVLDREQSWEEAWGALEAAMDRIGRAAHG